ncbi:hypothetical protein [Mobilicoccus pelagius]|uniref:Uncharacterized protein n=1 Tax=Mobilicoccus pelagius NBRC 104925 TaxID=1089455 RepID=H5UW80_9MICO|nr:hypothetical protein [Mobilicoccus pelagius]GAB49988.1 hypothetical protein MOPEL_136_00010 [Mobilicoccus pelagius NBRC 104925]
MMHTRTLAKPLLCGTLAVGIAAIPLTASADTPLVPTAPPPAPTAVPSPSEGYPKAPSDAEANPRGLPGQHGCIYVRGIHWSICVVNKVDDATAARIRSWLPGSPTGKSILGNPDSYLDDGRLKGKFIGDLCESAGGQALLIYGHEIKSYRQIQYNGMTRNFDQISTKKINGQLKKIYWEGKANTAGRDAHEMDVDPKLLKAGFELHDYWCGIDIRTGALGNMYISDDRL